MCCKAQVKLLVKHSLVEQTRENNSWVNVTTKLYVRKIFRQNGNDIVNYIYIYPFKHVFINRHFLRDQNGQIYSYRKLKSDIANYDTEKAASIFQVYKLDSTHVTRLYNNLKNTIVGYRI